MAGSQQKRNDLLRKVRLAAGLSQSQLAEKIGVDEKSVQRWESGKSTPRPSLLRDLCDALAKTPEELGFGYPEAPQSREEDQSALQQREQEQYQEKQKQDALPLPMPLEKRTSLPLGRRHFYLLIGIVITLVVAILVDEAVTVAFPSLPILGQSDCGQPFSGAFQGQLDARWRWDNPTGKAHLDWDPQGSLSITAPANSDLNLSHKKLNAPRLLQPITGNFTIQTHLVFHPTRNFQSAGLLLWQDSTKFMQLERAYGKENGLLFHENVDNRSTSVGTSDSLTSAQTLDLRVRKEGVHVTASWQEHGHAWQTVGATDLTFDRLMVGLDVLADFGAPPTTATFTSFIVSCG